MEQIESKKNLEGLKDFLRSHGTTLSRVAREHGYSPKLFCQVARRYWGQERKPSGIGSAAMLKALHDKIAEIDSVCGGSE